MSTPKISANNSLRQNLEALATAELEAPSGYAEATVDSIVGYYLDSAKSLGEEKRRVGAAIAEMQATSSAYRKWLDANGTHLDHIERVAEDQAAAALAKYQKRCGNVVTTAIPSVSTCDALLRDANRAQADVDATATRVEHQRNRPAMMDTLQKATRETLEQRLAFDSAHPEAFNAALSTQALDAASQIGELVRQLSATVTDASPKQLDALYYVIYREYRSLQDSLDHYGVRANAAAKKQAERVLDALNKEDARLSEQCRSASKASGERCPI